MSPSYGSVENWKQDRYVEVGPKDPMPVVYYHLKVILKVRKLVPPIHFEVVKLLSSFDPAVVLVLPSQYPKLLVPTA